MTFLSMGNVEWTALQNNLLSLWFPGHAQIPIVVTLIALKKRTIDYIHLLHFSSISKCLGKQPISDYRNVNCVSRNRYVCIIVLPSDTGNSDKWVQLTKGLFKIHSSGSHLQGSHGCWASLTHYQTEGDQCGRSESTFPLFFILWVQVLHTANSPWGCTSPH